VINPGDAPPSTVEGCGEQRDALSASHPDRESVRRRAGHWAGRQGRPPFLVLVLSSSCGRGRATPRIRVGGRGVPARYRRRGPIASIPQLHAARWRVRGPRRARPLAGARPPSGEGAFSSLASARSGAAPALIFLANVGGPSSRSTRGPARVVPPDRPIGHQGRSKGKRIFRPSRSRSGGAKPVHRGRTSRRAMEGWRRRDAGPYSSLNTNTNPAQVSQVGGQGWGLTRPVNRGRST